jgi:hypothetical protein
MDIKQARDRKQDEDELYLTIWQAEQEFSKTRWAIVTFFLGISFAILGYSFQPGLIWSQTIAIRIFGIFVYWFAYLLYIHFYKFTISLRGYLINMEDTGRTNLDIQSAIGDPPSVKRKINTNRLLFIFGLICSTGVILLSLFGP